MFVSIVCPFYNEENVLESSVRAMLDALSRLEITHELIIVDDGSTDGSFDIARRLQSTQPRLRIAGYPVNKGRGHAIRTGAALARGDILVTTEIDGSWGYETVLRIVDEFRSHPDTDMVVASPNLPGGAYRNIPWLRVALSKLGNRLIRAGLHSRLTMNTGMTRGYRRERFLALPLEEDGKEMHLEIVTKAIALSFQIREVPAVLEWTPERRRVVDARRRRGDNPSSSLARIIRGHLAFTLVAAPFRYIFFLSALVMLLSFSTFSFAVYRVFSPLPSIYWLLTSFLLFIISFMFFAVGILAHQNWEILNELWRLRSTRRGAIKADPD